MTEDGNIFATCSSAQVRHSVIADTCVEQARVLDRSNLSAVRLARVSRLPVPRFQDRVRRAAGSGRCISVL
jgi:hypothetical protein